MLSLATIGIIGLITGAVVGTTKLIDYIVGNNDAINELEIEKGNLETQYLDKDDQLVADTRQKLNTAELEYNQSKAKQELDFKQANDKLDQSYNQDVKNTTLNFETNKKEAYHNAAVSDQKETFNEWLYSNELNSQLNILNQNQKLMANNYNQASIGIGQNTGNALSAAAASGTRTSSMNTAIDLENAANFQQLQLSQDADRAGLANSYQSLTLQGAARNFNIQQTRDANNYLRASYVEGGSNYNLYKNALADLQSNYDLARNQMAVTNDLNLSQLEQGYNNYVNNVKENYELASTSMLHLYEQNDAKLQRQLDDRRDPWKNFLRGGTALLGGSIEGFKTGTGVATSVSNYFG